MTITVNFFGWCSEGEHDKVWGFVTTEGGTLYNFWGRRGKTLRFKKYEGSWGQKELEKKSREKVKPRPSGQYDEVEVSQIPNVVPGFLDELERDIAMAVMFDKVS